MSILFDVKVDISNQFTNEQEFDVYDHMLQWIHMKATKFVRHVISHTRRGWIMFKKNLDLKNFSN